MYLLQAYQEPRCHANSKEQHVTFPQGPMSSYRKDFGPKLLKHLEWDPMKEPLKQVPFQGTQVKNPKKESTLYRKYFQAKVCAIEIHGPSRLSGQA